MEIPIFVLNNGGGPSILLTGGVHGDEYERQIAVLRLARTLRAEDIQGRVVMIPALNLPAVLNDKRISPGDQRDLNRCFPGNQRGTFSERLAHFVDSVILPHVDVSIDLHTAGHSMEAPLSTNMHFVTDQVLRQRTLEAAAAFGAPFNVVFRGVRQGATLTSAVERRGILSLGTELGGWGRVSVEGVRIGERGVRNILRHCRLTDGKPETQQRDGAPGTHHMMRRDPRSYIFTPCTGLFEPRHLAAQAVEEGELAGYLHFVEDTERTSIELRYGASGVLGMASGPGRVVRADVVAAVMHNYDDQVAQT